MKKINSGLLAVLSTMSFLVNSGAVQNNPSDFNSNNNNENTNPYKEMYLSEQEIIIKEQQLKEITQKLGSIDEAAKKMVKMLKISGDLDRDFNSLVEEEIIEGWGYKTYPTGWYCFILPSKPKTTNDKQQYKSYLEQLIQQRNLILDTISGKETSYTELLQTQYQTQYQKVKLGKIIASNIESLKSLTLNLNQIISQNQAAQNMVQDIKLKEKFDSLIEPEMTIDGKQDNYYTGRYKFKMLPEYTDKDDLEEYNTWLLKLTQQRTQILEAITQ